MSENLIYGGGLAFYLGLMVLIGYLVKDRIKTSEDYLVGGRSFGLFYNSGTLAACFLGGGVFCLFCDLIARTAFAPTEVSISSVTAVFGAPIVIYMMIHRKAA